MQSYENKCKGIDEETAKKQLEKNLKEAHMTSLRLIESIGEVHKDAVLPSTKETRERALQRYVTYP